MTALAAQVARERPIIFSGPMIRAVLDGRKTQTRRIVKPQPKIIHAMHSDASLTTERIFRSGDQRIHCPYGAPGDRLWVREALTHVTCDPVTGEDCSVHCYTASIPPSKTSANPYEANYLFSDDDDPPLPSSNISPIHMPRWASRILLEIVNVRVERLQAISAKDILAEGAVDRPHVDQFGRNPVSAFDGKVYLDLISLWAAGWNAINGKRAPWKLNPWVWVIEFKVLP